MYLLQTRQLLAAWGVALFCGALGGGVASAQILFDGFDYAVGDLAGNNGGVGWAPNSIEGDGAWGVVVDSGLTGAATVANGSLTLSTYPTVGNRMRIETTASTDFSTAKFVRPFRSIDTTVTSGELWQSFLWRRVDDTEFNGDGELDGMQSEIRNNGGGGVPIHFRVRPKRQNIDGVGLRYDGQISTPPGEIEDFTVNNGETYLFIMRFTNLGTTDMSGRATMWVLNAADYDAIEAGGNLKINRTLLAEAPSTGTAAIQMLPGQNYRIFNQYNDLAAFNSAPFITEWDELRWGTTIGDVVPGWGMSEIVPEPGAGLLAALGGLQMAALARRKR